MGMEGVNPDPGIGVSDAVRHHAAPTKDGVLVNAPRQRGPVPRGLYYD